jgi:hypothetical protein
MSDLWMYNTESSELPWTKIFGSLNSGYNAKLAETDKRKISDSVHPHSTAGPGFCFDAAKNTLWMFGGMHSIVSVKMRRTNVLWKYDLTTQEWQWVSGDATATVPSSRAPSEKGKGGFDFYPGARYATLLWQIHTCRCSHRKRMIAGRIRSCGATPNNRSCTSTAASDSKTSLWVDLMISGSMTFSRIVGRYCQTSPSSTTLLQRLRRPTRRRQSPRIQGRDLVQHIGSMRRSIIYTYLEAWARKVRTPLPCLVALVRSACFN